MSVLPDNDQGMGAKPSCHPVQYQCWVVRPGYHKQGTVFEEEASILVRACDCSNSPGDLGGDERRRLVSAEPPAGTRERHSRRLDRCRQSGRVQRLAQARQEQDQGRMNGGRCAGGRLAGGRSQPAVS